MERKLQPSTTMTVNGSVAAGDLFVFYGLLRQGAAGAPDHIPFTRAGRFLGPCRFHGHMVDCGGYPGVVKGDGLCHGVRYRIEDILIVPALDAFEVVIPDDPDRSLYDRVPWRVLDMHGNPTGETAWLYCYRRPVTGLPSVANGVWPL